MIAGIAIFDNSIKLVLQGKVPRCVTIPLEKDVVKEGKLINADILTKHLSRLVEKYNLRGAEVVWGIPEHEIFTKKLSVSYQIGEVEVAIQKALASSLPSAIQDAYIDWQVVKEEGGQETIFFASVPEEFVDKYLDVFDKVGLHIVAIEPFTSAVARSLSTPAQKTLAIISNETEVILAILSEQHKIELTSSIPPEIISNSAELSEEVTRMVNFYVKMNKKDQPEPAKNPQTPQPKTSIAQVVITGINLSEGLKSLGQLLGVPATFESIPTVANSAPFFSVYALTTFPVGYSKKHEWINLLPEKRLEDVHALHKQARLQKIVRTLALCYATLGLLLLALFAYFQVNIYLTERAIAAEKASANKAATQAYNRVQAVNSASELIIELSGSPEPQATLLFLAQKTPGGVAITHYMIDLAAKKVAVSGVSSDRDLILAFQQTIESTETYDNVVVPLTSLQKKGTSPFSLSFEYK